MNQKNLGITETFVSEICLGTMYFGTKTSKRVSFDILDAFFEQNGNFIDTANNYSWWSGGRGDESEVAIGRWMQLRKNRNSVVLASKVGSRPLHEQLPTYVREGLRKDTIITSVNESLMRLRTHYLDLCYIHTDLEEYPLEERLEALEILKTQGKVLFKGCSNISHSRYLDSEALNENEGWEKFNAVQQKFSYLLPNNTTAKDNLKFVDSQLIKKVEESHTSLLTYSPLLSGSYEKGYESLPKDYQSFKNKKLFDELYEKSKKMNCSRSQLVLCWLIKQSPQIIPLIGVSSVKQLHHNLMALSMDINF
jgi:aryl-alcohol dehydrogenase-like predicted oxidoreductase